MDEKGAKPRNHKKTGLSKKEKQSSVPLLPSPPCLSSDLSEDVCQGDLERIRENINDLIMWRDVAKSTLWFGFGCFVSCLLALLKDSALVFSQRSLMLGFCFSGVTEETERREVKLSEEDVLRVARRMLPVTNFGDFRDGPAFLWRTSNDTRSGTLCPNRSRVRLPHNIVEAMCFRFRASLCLSCSRLATCLIWKHFAQNHKLGSIKKLSDSISPVIKSSFPRVPSISPNQDDIDRFFDVLQNFCRFVDNSGGGSVVVEDWNEQW